MSCGLMVRANIKFLKALKLDYMCLAIPKINFKIRLQKIISYLKKIYLKKFLIEMVNN